MRRQIAGLALILASFGASAEEQRWVATWGTAQTLAAGANRSSAPTGRPAAAAPTPTPTVASRQTPAGPQRRFPVPRQLASVTNQTIRMVVRSSIPGGTIRVRLSNAINAPAVRIGAAHVALRSQESTIVPASDRVLTFSGKPEAVMYGGQVLISDPVKLEVPALSDLAVSLYLPGETPTSTSHWFALHTTYVSETGDFAGQASFVNATKLESYYWLAGVDVLAPASAGTLVTFGDSITDGDQSTLETNGAWPSILAARLQKNKATAKIGVVNAGIAGNRVLGDRGALSRMYHDVLSHPGVRWIMLLEGINDITGGTRANSSPTLTAEDLISAYRQIIETARVHGIKIIGCTITPYGGSGVYTEAGEAVREAVNAWTRTPGNFDAVVDFDRAVRDPKDPKRFRAEADSPDMLHPGDAGYRLMGEAIELSVFTKGGAVRKNVRQP